MGRRLERLLSAFAAFPPWRSALDAARSHREHVRLVASALRVARLILFVPGVRIGFDSRVGPGCRFLCGPGAEIDVRNCDLTRDVTLDAADGATIRLMADHVGPGTIISARSSVTIAEGCWLADYVTMRDANHDSTAGRLSELHFAVAPIHIGENSWLGSKSTLVAGVTLGSDVVVAAGAVVTRDVRSGQRVGGVPATPLSAHAPSRAS